MPVVMNGMTFYRVGCTRKDGVARFGPEIMENSLFESGEDFRNLLLTKGNKKKREKYLFFFSCEWKFGDFKSSFLY